MNFTAHLFKNVRFAKPYFVQPVLFGIFGNMLFINCKSIFKKLITVLIVCLLQSPVNAQPPSFNFHQLSTSNGLSNPTIRNIIQDKYGYIWIATLNGLNRFNGYEVKVFQHKLNDSFSLQQSYVPTLLADDAGNLWVAQSKGIYKYDYNNGHFTLQQGSYDISTTKMVKGGAGEIYLSTYHGLVLFNTVKNTFTFLKNNTDGLSKILLSRPVNDFCVNSNGNIYLTTDTGLIIYNRTTRFAERKILAPIKNESIENIAVDSAGNVWISYGYSGALLLKTDADFRNYRFYTQFNNAEKKLSDNRITAIFSDSKGSVWLATALSGLCLYNAADNNFIQYEHDPLQATSISDNLVTSIFQDKQGFMWVGTEVSGVNYFQPGKDFFHSIQPSFNQSPTLPGSWCRAAGEDKDGNLWLGTARGIAKYNPQVNSYTLFQHTSDKDNTVQYNSIRSIVCDSNFVWIGTGNGLNRYCISTGKMDFLGEKDSLPSSFFWSILKDHENNIWFGSRDGFYKYNNHTHKIENLRNNTALAAYANNNTLSLYEDSEHHIWFGFYSKGLLMYNPANKKTNYWVKNDTAPTALSDNRITSITEDRKGIIWIATLDGLNAYNKNDNKFTQYLRGNGMASESTAALMVDDSNRLWFAASKGLGMLEPARKNFKYFDMSDGLPSVDLNNQGALRLKNGNFIYPTFKGFVQFNPNHYADTVTNFDVYISSVKVYGKELPASISFEEIKNISLKSGENFFSLEMLALNYRNPYETWYAHKLEPFDKDWVYSKDRAVDYTNVPGGDYTFRYKTSTDINNWNVPEKAVHIYLATVFYKTWWFRLSVLLLLASFLYLLYQFRMKKKEELYSLQAKAQALEKEKVLVMYESLKQQLNPHFLFNSLTSLSGLITTNPDNAKQFLERMSKIYRYILKSRDNETVALIEEIKLAETYTQLQQTRFNDGLQLHLDVPEEYLYRKIAPVTIQNLIENAIKHNILHITKPLVIDIFIEADWLVIRNNLQKKKFVETSNKQGLNSMRSLYQYLAGRPLIITQDENYFTVKIPLI